MDKETVQKVARIAHIQLSEEELEKYSKDLAEIVEYFKMLDDAPELETEGFTPIEVSDILREDEPHTDIEPEKILSNMNTYEDYVRGPKLS